MGWAIAFCLFFAAIWSIVYVAAGNEYLVPSRSETLLECSSLLSEFSFWQGVLSTLLRAAEAFLFALIFGAVFAFISDMVPVFSRLISPAVSVLRSLPTMAVLLCILVWSTPLRAPVIVAFLSLFPMLYTATRSANAAVSRELRELCAVYRVPLRRQIVCLYLPTVAPYLLRECAAALAFALKLTVSAEIMANAYRSLGWLMQESQIYTDMPRLFALTLFVVLFGWLIESVGLLLAQLAERRLK